MTVPIVVQPGVQGAGRLGLPQWMAPRTVGCNGPAVAVAALPGFRLETLAMLPLILAYTASQNSQGHAVFTGFDARTRVLLALAGAMTALPLMFLSPPLPSSGRTQ